jgi:hypothetical protein
MNPIMPALPAETEPFFLLFTGHMIDAPTRAVPRFPAEKEPAAREAIRAAVRNLRDDRPEAVMQGLAGGACGGDILFHEVCAELGIATSVYLALPAPELLAASVAFAGPDWVERFGRLLESRPSHLYRGGEDLPEWLAPRPDATVWEGANLLMLRDALAAGGRHMALLALWDGRRGDGPGGTGHLVELVRRQGGRVVVIDTTAL